MQRIKNSHIGLVTQILRSFALSGHLVFLNNLLDPWNQTSANLCVFIGRLLRSGFVHGHFLGLYSGVKWRVCLKLLSQEPWGSSKHLCKVALQKTERQITIHMLLCDNGWQHVQVAERPNWVLPDFFSCQSSPASSGLDYIIEASNRHQF